MRRKTQARPNPVGTVRMKIHETRRTLDDTKAHKRTQVGTVCGTRRNPRRKVKKHKNVPLCEARRILDESESPRQANVPSTRQSRASGKRRRKNARRKKRENGVQRRSHDENDFLFRLQGLSWPRVEAPDVGR